MSHGFWLGSLPTSAQDARCDALPSGCLLVFSQKWDCWCSWIFMNYWKIGFENKTTDCMVFFSIISIHTLYQNGMLARQLGNPMRSAKKLYLLWKKKIHLCQQGKDCLVLGRRCSEGVKTGFIGVGVGIFSELNQRHRSKAVHRGIR